MKDKIPLQGDQVPWALATSRTFLHSSIYVLEHLLQGQAWLIHHLQELTGKDAMTTWWAILSRLPFASRIQDCRALGACGDTNHRQAGVLDIVSSDYVPSSIIQGVFKPWQAGAKKSLPEAVATVSRTPAQITELSDRGEITVGKRADLIRVAMDEDTPVVANVWRAGERII